MIEYNAIIINDYTLFRINISMELNQILHMNHYLVV